MELSPKQQIVELIKQSQKILLVSHIRPGGDSIGSILALSKILKESGKEVRAVVSDNLPSHVLFLPGLAEIKKDLQDNRNLLLRINLTNTEIDKILTKTEDNFLNIILETTKGHLTKEAVEVSSTVPKFDCIIVLDTQDVDKIDKIYDEYTELFFETPIINIDHHSGNEYFGTINLVELTATSTAEILVSIIEALGKSKLDEDTATCLLAGITADTASFKSINTTPKSLTVAAQLLAAGARQQEIIQNFYKTKNLKTLKLWGKTLLSLRSNPELRIVWSSVRHKDLEESGVSIEEAQEVLDDLLANTPGADVVCLIIEIEPNHFAMKLKGVKGSDVLEIAEAFGGTGHALSAGFEIKNVGFEAAEFQVIKIIQEIRSKKIGRPISEEKVVTDSKKGDEAQIQVPKAVSTVGKTVIEDGPKSEKDPITRAIESLEAAKTDEKPESLPIEPEKLIETDNLTPLSEILKKFTPGQLRENEDSHREKQ